MAIDPREFELSPEQQHQLEELAHSTGQPWHQVLCEALMSYRLQTGTRRPATERSLFDAMREDGVIGIVKDGLPQDLSTNPKRMEGFGRDNEAGTG